MRLEVPPIESIRHVHLVAICGTAMGSLAAMLVDRGFRVTGSDSDAYPPMSDQLRAAGIEVQKGFAPEHVLSDRPDLVVIGNAVRRENPEARAAIDGGIPYVSFCDAIHHFFLRGKHSVVITGTHGKTTTTSIVAWMLTHAGRDPSALIGGVFANFAGSFRLGEGPEFVIEGDEYDTAFFDKTPKFLHYDARTLLVTSVEFDHADIYGSLDQIQDAFRTLVAQIPDGRRDHRGERRRFGARGPRRSEGQSRGLRLPRWCGLARLRRRIRSRRHAVHRLAPRRARRPRAHADARPTQRRERARCDRGVREPRRGTRSRFARRWPSFAA